MNNVIDAINVLIEGVNIAYSRGSYSMAETHDLHKAIEFIKSAANTTQQAEAEAQVVNKKDKKEKDDY
jgi:hypothetical protein